MLPSLYKNIILQKENTVHLFKNTYTRLIITYFPGMIIPVVTETSLKSYFDRLGLTYDDNKDDINNNIILRDWKNSVPELS